MGDVTWVEENVCVCNDCGSYARSESNIIHHETCIPGESKKWEKIYNEEVE